MIVISVVAVLLIVILAIFSFPEISPVPYFPSNQKDIPLILKTLSLKDEQTIIDFGAGDGLIIFESAHETFKKKLNTQFVAVEINPILIFILYLRRFFHPNKKNIQILWTDMFKFKSIKQYSNITIFLYISPWFLERALKHIQTIKGKKTIVSYYYPIKSLRPTLAVRNSVNPVFRYEI